MVTEHIVKSFEEELTRIHEHIALMGERVATQLVEAVRALSERDSELAWQVIAGDEAVDALEREIDALAIQVLALRQPIAMDLRDVLSALKIAADLERIGDYAANVAKRAVAINQMGVIKPTGGIPRLGKVVEAMIRDVLSAYADKDIARAVAVWNRDEELDEMYSGLFRELLTYMMEDPRNITAAAHLLFIAKNVERVGDHATNIAETVYFLVKGEPLKAERPKHDQSSFAILQPVDRTH